MSTYTVKPGDTLSAIALAVLGNGNRWLEIQELNRLVNPNRLLIGQTIKLPDKNAVSTGVVQVKPQAGPSVLFGI
jgi:nucleoid-associated protein YgaU